MDIIVLKIKDSYPYINITVPREKEEELLNLLYSLGFEKIAYKKDAGDYNTIDQDDLYLCLECFLKHGDNLDQCRDSLINAFPGLGAESDLSIKYKKNEDWASDFKKHFKAVSIAGGYTVVPPWDNSKGDNIIYIDPGMAFGTGSHFTTKTMCYFITQADFLDDRFVLDLGSGSCLLSVLSAKLRASIVISVEKDNYSIRNAKTNIMINKCQDQCMLIKADMLNLPLKINHVLKFFINIDLNIISEFLYRNMRSIPENSRIFMAGILNSEKGEFEKLMRDLGMIIRTELSDGEWLSCSAEKN